MYNELSMPEFCAGYLVIVQQSATKPHLAALLEHFHQLMVLASTYQWSAVPSFHYKVLHSLKLGLVKWGDSFNHLKVQFLTPSSLLSESAPRKMAKAPVSSDAINTPPKPAIWRNQICDELSWCNTVCQEIVPSSRSVSRVNGQTTKPLLAPSGSSNTSLPHGATVPRLTT